MPNPREEETEIHLPLSGDDEQDLQLPLGDEKKKEKKHEHKKHCPHRAQDAALIQPPGTSSLPTTANLPTTVVPSYIDHKDQGLSLQEIVQRQHQASPPPPPPPPPPRMKHNTPAPSCVPQQADPFSQVSNFKQQGWTPQEIVAHRATRQRHQVQDANSTIAPPHNPNRVPSFIGYKDQGLTLQAIQARNNTSSPRHRQGPQDANDSSTNNSALVPPYNPTHVPSNINYKDQGLTLPEIQARNNNSSQGPRPVTTNPRGPNRNNGGGMRKERPSTATAQTAASHSNVAIAYAVEVPPEELNPFGTPPAISTGYPQGTVSGYPNATPDTPGDNTNKKPWYRTKWFVWGTVVVGITVFLAIVIGIVLSSSSSSGEPDSSQTSLTTGPTTSDQATPESPTGPTAPNTPATPATPAAPAAPATTTTTEDAFATTPVQDHTWTLLLPIITGPVAEDFFGAQVSVAAPGKVSLWTSQRRVSVSAPGGWTSFDGDFEGRVSIYDIDDEGTATPMGGPVLGSKPGAGAKGVLSRGGSRLAVAEPDYQGADGQQNIGQVCVLEIISDLSGGGIQQGGGDTTTTMTGDCSDCQWTPVGDPIHPIVDNGDSRKDVTVALSDNGDVLAIGSQIDTGGWIGRLGRRRTQENVSHRLQVYEYKSGVWTKLGNDIELETSWDKSGYSVSLSEDGRAVAIGVDYNSGNQNRGKAMVFSYTGTVWEQLGSSIEGLFK